MKKNTARGRILRAFAEGEGLTRRDIILRAGLNDTSEITKAEQSDLLHKSWVPKRPVIYTLTEHGHEMQRLYL